MEGELSHLKLSRVPGSIRTEVQGLSRILANLHSLKFTPFKKRIGNSKGLIYRHKDRTME